MAKERLSTIASHILLRRLTQTDISGGSADTDKKELTVSASRWPPRFVVMTETSDAALRMADRKTSREIGCGSGCRDMLNACGVSTVASIFSLLLNSIAVFRETGGSH